MGCLDGRRWQTEERGSRSGPRSTFGITSLFASLRHVLPTLLLAPISPRENFSLHPKDLAHTYVGHISDMLCLRQVSDKPDPEDPMTRLVTLSWEVQFSILTVVRQTRKETTQCAQNGHGCGDRQQQRACSRPCISLSIRKR